MLNGLVTIDSRVGRKNSYEQIGKTNTSNKWFIMTRFILTFRPKESVSLNRSICNFMILPIELELYAFWIFFTIA